MGHNNEFSRTVADRSPAAANNPTPPKRTHNNPVTVEEFDREHMGIAAKE